MSSIDKHLWLNQKIQLMKAISKRYFKCQRIIRNVKYTYTNAGEDNISLNMALHYVSCVENVFAALDPVDKMIINNDFFYENYKFWWEKIYSHNSYYRIRTKAINSFLRLIDGPDIGGRTNETVLFE